MDYAEVWLPRQSGVCTRAVYGVNGWPERCGKPSVGVGWGWYPHPRKWLAFEACEEHVGQLEKRPYHSPRGDGG